MQNLPDGKPQTRAKTKVIRKKVCMVTLLFNNPLSIELAIYRGEFVYVFTRGPGKPGVCLPLFVELVC